MKILVAVPPSVVPATGPAYVAATLKRAGHEVVGHCFRRNREFRSLFQSGGFEAVMTGGLVSQYRAIKRMVDTAHEEGVKVVVGGGIVSSEPELMTRALAADYSVLGQGEVTAVELAALLAAGSDPGAVKGIGYVRAGQFVQTPARPEIEDLDALPFPDFDAFGFAERLDTMRPSDRDTVTLFDHPREYPLVASRSCPYHCTFCYHTSGYRYRKRSVASVMDELRAVVPKYRLNLVWVLDELFGESEDRVREFCRELKAFRAGLPWDLRWSCFLRVAGLKGETLDIMKDAGCHTVAYGFESYSAKVLTSMKKHITPEQIHSAIHATLDRKLAQSGSFIFGDRAETQETARETLDFWKAHPEAGIWIGPIFTCPDSSDYRYCISKGLIKDRLRHVRDRWFEPVNMTTMPDSQFYALVVELMQLISLAVPWVVPLSRGEDWITVQCPHCREVVRYGNFRFGAWQRKNLICRSCQRRFFLSTRLRMFAQKAVATITPRYAWSYYVYRDLHRLVKRVKTISETIRDSSRPLRVQRNAAASVGPVRVPVKVAIPEIRPEDCEAALEGAANKGDFHNASG